MDVMILGSFLESRHLAGGQARGLVNHKARRTRVMLFAVYRDCVFQQGLRIVLAQVRLPVIFVQLCLGAFHDDAFPAFVEDLGDRRHHAVAFQTPIETDTHKARRKLTRVPQ